MNKERIRAKVTLGLPLTKREKAYFILFIAKDESEYKPLLRDLI
jgi:hypothetical protein